MRQTLVVCFGLMLLPLASCSKPDCDKTINHAFGILEKAGTKRAADEKKSEEDMKAMVATMKEQKTQALADCKKGTPKPLTMNHQKCVLGAKTEDELKKCNAPATN